MESANWISAIAVLPSEAYALPPSLPPSLLPSLPPSLSSTYLIEGRENVVSELNLGNRRLAQGGVPDPEARNAL